MSANIILCETGYYRSSCVECQRRKQKCNREWPCDSCRRRKVPDGCRYNDAPVPSDGPSQPVKPEKPAHLREKRPSRAGLDENGGNQVFETLAERAFASMGIDESVKNESSMSKQDMVQPDSSSQLEAVLKMLPQRTLMDVLIQMFVGDVNYHYYIIYPPSFLQEYHIWWDKRTSKKAVSLQYTALLAMLCSCAVQHIEPPTQQVLEAEVGQASDPYSEDLHTAVRELSSVIPTGHYHILNVQRLLHSCYWYKAEARFVEAWHVLNQAIIEAKELELHIEAPEGSISEFEREMRRRLWSILETWDWQISSGLSRPKLIDRLAATVALPSLTLEGYNPHPMLHMKMQADLTRDLQARFNTPKNIVSPEDINEYKDMIIGWVARFPPEYDFYNPNTSKDDIHPWIFPHRFYVYTMACILILNPIRNYMVKSYTWESPKEDIDVRNIGVFYSLVFIQTLRRWVDRIKNRDGRLHFIIFSIFDTAAMLCTAVLKDTEKTLPREGEILESITRSIAMLKTLMVISKTAKISHDILYRLAKKLPQMRGAMSSKDDRRKKVKTNRLSPASTISQGPSQPPVPSPKPILSQQQEQQHQTLPKPPPPRGLVSTPAPEPAMLAAAAAKKPPPPPVPPVPRFDRNNYISSTLPMANYSSNGSYMATPIPVESGQPIGVQVLQPTHAHISPPAQMQGHEQTSMSGQELLPQSFSTHLGADVPAVATYWNNTTTPPTIPSPPNYPVVQPIGNNGYVMPDNHMSSMANQPAMFAFPPPGEDHVPDLNLASLTDAQLGGLAPLWTWHASNIDFEAMRNEESPQGQM